MLGVFDHFNLLNRLCLMCAHAQMTIYAHSSFYHMTLTKYIGRYDPKKDEYPTFVLFTI